MLLRMAGSVRTYPWAQHGSPECGVHILVMDPHRDTPAHDHLFHEIAFIDAGSGRHRTVAGETTVSAGQVILLRPQVWHHYHKCREMRVINCLVNPTLLNQLLPLLRPAEGAFELFGRRLSHPRQSPPLVLRPARAIRQQMATTLRAMLDESQRRTVGWQSAMAAGLLLLLTLCARASRGPTRVGSEAVSDQARQSVHEIAHYLAGHYTQPVVLQTLAQRAGLSPAHLSRCFSREMGMGLVQHVHHLRTEEACRLLRLTELPVTDIAARLGYNEIAWFSRMFRARMGISPMAYRQQRQTAE